MGKLSAVSYQLSAIASRFKSSPGHAGCDRRPRRRCSTWTWARREGRRLPPPPLLDSPGHDNHFSFRELDVAVAELDPHPPLHDEKQLVLLLVLVPHEFPLELDELDGAVVDLADDLRAPMFVKQREFVSEFDLLRFHVTSLPARGCREARATSTSPA